jgi:hypothetical protein
MENFKEGIIDKKNQSVSLETNRYQHEFGDE